MGSHDLYLAHRALIEQAINAVCRRARLSPLDAEDFSGIVRLHLLEGDCAVLRRFQGRSSLKTFLVTVVANQFRDWRNARWGKWRPSAEARRLGPLAMLLEQLLTRDQLSFDEAVETLRTNHQVRESTAVLEAMAARFPRRSARHIISDDMLESVADPAADAEVPVRRLEAQKKARTVDRALAEALATLPAQDRLIVQLRFGDGCSFAEIARALHLEQKPLYRRMERLLHHLRVNLETAGVSANQARELIGDDAVSDFHLRDAGRRGSVTPARADTGTSASDGRVA